MTFSYKNIFSSLLKIQKYIGEVSFFVKEKVKKGKERGKKSLFATFSADSKRANEGGGGGGHLRVQLVYASLHNLLKNLDFSKCDVLSEVYRVTCPNSYITVTLIQRIKLSIILKGFGTTMYYVCKTEYVSKLCNVA